MPTVTHTVRPAWAVLTQDGLDQVCDTRAQAYREARDLRALGSTTSVKSFPTWGEAEDYGERLRARR